MTGSELLYLQFNQDYGCFAAGTSNGFRVYNCDPYKESFCRGFDGGPGGIGIVEMLFRCNILAIVGGGAAPRYPPTKVMIWDDHQGKCIGELSFRSQVRAVKLRRDRIVVALEHKVLVYNFADLKLLHQIETLANPKGLVAVSSTAESTVLACPGLHTGQIRVELYDRRQTKFISAHNNALSALSLSLCGKRLASASDKGTLVRVWNTADGQLLQELRRGADHAIIHSIALSRGCDWLAVSSDKSTVHVFALSEAVSTGAGAGVQRSSPSATNSPTMVPGASVMEPPSSSNVGGQDDGAPGSGSNGGALSTPPPPPRSNPTSILSVVKGIVPSLALPKYFQSEWSFAQARLSSDDVGCRSLVGFGPQPNTLCIITMSGAFYKVSFDPSKGGACSQEVYTRFIDPQAAAAGGAGGAAPPSS
uniref:WD repeat domain phosphoinositide-interacting protein 3 n=1 Tax=Chlamydomonas leiostraca TaxID=1034604 RepID=A0A7S0WRP9_9CHLO|mmetsp:Transcript_24392/g.62011  ORF Transcript_24392/g.62011 Transcript_24392/m.62011 type:complete len:420 (+) Transcript_24392:139-1398(+)